MTTPTSRAAYRPYYELLDRAMEAEKGIRVRVSDFGEAYQLRVKLHTARTLDRTLSRETYDLGDPKYGVSIYDGLVVKVKQDGDDVVVEIAPGVAIGEVEEIKG